MGMKQERVKYFKKFFIRFFLIPRGYIIAGCFHWYMRMNTMVIPGEVEHQILK